MLSIAHTIAVPGATAFPDDERWNAFYLVPNLPAVRRREDGSPVFLLASYQFGEDDRAADPSLPRGAGYLQFDVDLALNAATLERVRVALQGVVDAEHRRRQADPALAADPLATGASPPAVELLDPVWSGGTVKLFTTGSDALVSERVAEQPAALLSGNNACFNLDLTGPGVSFFQQLLVTEAGAGRIDIAPVSVAYSLQMWARLPPLRATLVAHSERLETVREELSSTNQDDFCTPSEVESQQEKGLNAASLLASGAIEVHIEAPAGVPPEAVEAVRSYVCELFDTMLRERFLVPVEAEGSPLRFDGAATPPAEEDSAAAWLYAGAGFQGAATAIEGDTASLGRAGRRLGSVQVRSGHTVTLYRSERYAGEALRLSSSAAHLPEGWSVHTGSIRVQRPTQSKRKLRQSINRSELDVQISISQSQIVEWTVGPQATLEPVFAGLSAAKMKKHVVELSLDAFRARPVTVRAYANFQRVAGVQVDLEYRGVGQDGREVIKQNSFTFDKSAPGPESVDWTQIGDSREYRYRYFTITAGTNTRSPLTPWMVSSATDLNIAVAEPGLIALEVSGASLDWSLLKSCVVTLELSTSQRGTVSRQVELLATKPSDSWHEALGEVPLGPLLATFTYHLVDDRVFDGEAVSVESGRNLLVVPPPLLDILNVTLLPGGDWSDVSGAVVLLRYPELDGTVREGTFRFRSVDELAEWKVPLRDPTRRRFEWEVTVTYRGDRPAELRPIMQAEGDQTLVIAVEGRPKINVAVNPALLDWTKLLAVQVDLFAASGPGNSLSFQKGGATTPVVWTQPIPEGGAPGWSWEVTWHPLEGDSLSSGRRPGVGNLLLVPRYEAPEVGLFTVSLRGNFVDWAVTPLVAVELGAHTVEGNETRSFELDKSVSAGKWELRLPSGAPLQYRFAITYFLADGTPVAGDSGTKDVPFLVVPAYKPFV